MRLVDAGRIALDDPMAAHLPGEMIGGLHQRKGVDHTGRITIRHLISNQTGLWDYFSIKGPDGRRPADTLMAGQDSPWPLERTLQAARG